ncbi:hypothetical protein HYDPIDRAFT_170916 [Hydnomerulius pinastri MD-312]|uniref:Unplaced genomic scaffold scaffold_59, whole genome shotgun sequence n=1 Tax=Hydnomerulius pinastri MD-312 TaxID=994086 RepID=A0A0C9W903_9AGAM|nr:hypothetical protein HYDPIDRAFT_170916 [Hydnomerulius pinastri MD-312]
MTRVYHWLFNHMHGGSNGEGKQKLLDLVPKKKDIASTIGKRDHKKEVDHLYSKYTKGCQQLGEKAMHGQTWHQQHFKAILKKPENTSLVMEINEYCAQARNGKDGELSGKSSEVPATIRTTLKYQLALNALTQTVDTAASQIHELTGAPSEWRFDYVVFSSWKDSKQKDMRSMMPKMATWLQPWIYFVGEAYSLRLKR